MGLFSRLFKSLNSGQKDKKFSYDHGDGRISHGPDDPSHGGPNRRKSSFGGKIDKSGGHVDKTTGKYHIHDYNKYYDKNNS